jgi:hypothetical protein
MLNSGRCAQGIDFHPAVQHEAGPSDKGFVPPMSIAWAWQPNVFVSRTEDL